VRFFDLSADPYELHDRSADPAAAAFACRQEEELDRTGDRWDGRDALAAAYPAASTVG